VEDNASLQGPLWNVEAWALKQ